MTVDQLLAAFVLQVGSGVAAVLVWLGVAVATVLVAVFGVLAIHKGVEFAYRLVRGERGASDAWVSWERSRTQEQHDFWQSEHDAGMAEWGVWEIATARADDAFAERFGEDYWHQSGVPRP